MGAAFKRFCARFCCCCCCDDDSEEEKQPILSHETLEYFDREAKKRRDQETNLWSEPNDPSHSERDDDRMLYNLLQSRAKQPAGSRGYRRMSVDIEAMRDMRREVRDNWKTILENLGFMTEAESLLTVSGNASFDRMHNAPMARTLLHTLHSETSIFNRERGPPPERYLFILDRLIYLDAADDFVAKARRFYPKKEDDDDEAEPGINLPLLLARVRAANGGEGDSDVLDEEESGRE